MNLAITPYSTNPNFGITSKVRIPMENGSTLLLNVTGEMKPSGTVNITRIVGDFMRKGKSVGKTKEYANKDGFNPNRFTVIADELSKGAKEPDTVIDKIFDAISNPSIDFNA